MNIQVKDISNLSKPNVFKSLFQIAFEYILIFSIILFTINFFNPFTVLLAIMLIGARQHGLSAVAHDAVHYRICKNKKLNDFISNILIYFPLLSSLQKYRTSHMLHHIKPNSEEDPDFINKKDNPEFKFPQTKINFLKNVFKYIFGVHHVATFFSLNKTWKQKLKYFFKGFTVVRPLDHVNHKESHTELYSSIAFNIILLTFFIVTGNGWYYLLFWVCPCFLYIPFIFRIRAICEHFGITKNNIDHSRTMYPNWFDRIFFGLNWNLSYHLDHHLFPSVPSYNVKKLHQKLLLNKDYRDNAQITPQGSWGVFRECTS